MLISALAKLRNVNFSYNQMGDDLRILGTFEFSKQCIKVLSPTKKGSPPPQKKIRYSVVRSDFEKRGRSRTFQHLLRKKSKENVIFTNKMSVILVL